jgi:hypothetical protein
LRLVIRQGMVRVIYGLDHWTTAGFGPD